MIGVYLITMKNRLIVCIGREKPFICGDFYQNVPTHHFLKEKKNFEVSDKKSGAISNLSMRY